MGSAGWGPHAGGIAEPPASPTRPSAAPRSGGYRLSHWCTFRSVAHSSPELNAGARARLRATEGLLDWYGGGMLGGATQQRLDRA